MNEPRLSTTRRHLPHWTLPESTYYITFRLFLGELDDTERNIVFEYIKSGHGIFYNLAAAMIMPYHVHLILKPHNEYDPSRILKGIKGTTARLLNIHRGSNGKVWQEESWDRIIRDAREYDEKVQYMYENPLRAGLTKDIHDYKYWHYNPDF